MTPMTVKSIICTALCSLVLLAAAPAEAGDKVRDNSLTFNDKRLEEQENDTLGETSAMTASLFQSENADRFASHKAQQSEEAAAALEGLFTQGEVRQQSQEVSDLFLGPAVSRKAAQQYATHQGEDRDSQVGLSADGFWLLMGYGLIVAVATGTAVFASSRVDRSAGSRADQV